MMVTKKALGRRTFLRGLGAAVSLPLLDAMVPALSATSQTAANPVPRMGFVFFPNGTYLPNWRPTGQGTEFTFSRILEPLAPHRAHVTIVSGLSNLEAETRGEGGGPHTRTQAVWLSGVRPKKTEGSDFRLGTTADQIAATAISRNTVLPSLELALEPSWGGGCDAGYSCVYINTFSWKSPTQPNPMETNPRVVFERLFGDGADAASRLAQSKADGSLLDWVLEDMARLRSRVGVRDQVTIDEYLDSLREVERRIQAAEKQNATLPPGFERPVGTPAAFDEYATVMFELMFLAFQTDMTRVATFQLAREQSLRTYPHIGVNDGYHAVSHHQGYAERIEPFTKIDTYHATLFAKLLDRMKSTPDGDGTLLDHSLLLYGGGMGDGDLHSPIDLPLVVAGGGCGQMVGGRHLQYPLNTPMSNLLVSMLHKVRIPIDSLGDSTGPLSNF